MAEGVLRVGLGVLAVYHLGMGLMATLVPRAAGRLGALLYAVEVEETPQLRYGLRMLGLYALAVGSLAALAAWDPRRRLPIIYVVIGLQLARATARLALRDEVAAAFGISSRRNAVHAVTLAVYAVALTVALAFL